MNVGEVWQGIYLDGADVNRVCRIIVQTNLAMLIKACW